MIQFKNEYIIYEKEIRCVIGENEFNYSTNPTITTGSFGDIKSSFIDNFTPYITTVGLYNDRNELLAVAKLSKPLKVSSNVDTTICVRLDF